MSKAALLASIVCIAAVAKGWPERTFSSSSSANATALLASVSCGFSFNGVAYTQVIGTDDTEKTWDPTKESPPLEISNAVAIARSFIAERFNDVTVEATEFRICRLGPSTKWYYAISFACDSLGAEPVKEGTNAEQNILLALSMEGKVPPLKRIPPGQLEFPLEGQRRTWDVQSYVNTFSEGGKTWIQEMPAETTLMWPAWNPAADPSPVILQEAIRNARRSVSLFIERPCDLNVKSIKLRSFGIMKRFGYIVVFERPAGHHDDLQVFVRPDGDVPVWAPLSPARPSATDIRGTSQQVTNRLGDESR